MIYLLLNVFLIWLGLNNHNIAGKLILTGEASNGIAFVSNNFKMPAIGATINEPFHTNISGTTNVPFLCDDFYLAIYEPQFINISFSLGDVLIAIGMINALFFQ